MTYTRLLDLYVNLSQFPGVSDVTTRREDDVLHVTLDRPERRNAMSRAMVDELRSVLAEAESCGVRVLVLRGAGGHFCAGGDIKDMAGARSAPRTDDHDPVAELNAAFGHLALAYARTPIATLAAVEGAVMGGGFGLACVTDVTLAAPSADFRLPETSLGLVPAQIAPFLIERLGFSEAKRLAVTGARFGADEAARIGLVHEVAADLDGAVARQLRAMLRCAPAATRATKALLFRLHGGVREQDIEHAGKVFAEAARGDEAVEGMTAFLGTRRPAWAPPKEQDHG